MIGETVGNYRILEELGAGGMGVVYKAQDVRLNRHLALKFLKPERISEEFKRRFYQEARAASALNHSGIIHIYDIGEWEGADYIAMEYVEGDTLHHVLRDRRLPLEESVRYAIEVADALIAAHAAGIVHRDLKPGNVMLAASGHIKVLDFGLAKLNEAPPATAVQTESDSTATIGYEFDATEPGTVFGSPPYMSPEQALGKPVDARSDIFAYGLLLYEMFAGHAAFRGATKIEVLSAVLHVDPPPPSKENPAVGKALDAVVARCLKKDPADRFQSMTEVKQALANRAPPPWRPGRRAWGSLAAGLIALAAFVLYWSRHADPGTAPAGVVTPATPTETARLTADSGLNIDPVISRDGTLIAYASDRGGQGNLDIWIKQTAGGKALQLTNDPADDTEPDFSPDGTQIVFRSAREGGGLYLVSTMGGAARKIADGGRRPKFSPDGTRIAYWKGVEWPFPLRAGSGKMFVLDFDRSLTNDVRADFAAAVDPVWSPDGKSLLFLGIKDEKDSKTYSWWITPVDNGAPRICPAFKTELLIPFAWRRDRVYFEWQERDQTTLGEVAVDATTGQTTSPLRRVTAGTAAEYSPSVSEKGQVVFSGIAEKENVYRIPLDANSGKVTGPIEPITRNANENTVRSISADGNRVTYNSFRDGKSEIWGKDLATGIEHEVTTGGQPKAGVLSPDGKWLAWRQNFQGVEDDYVSPFEGGAPRLICKDCARAGPWTPDAKFLLVRRKSTKGADLLDLETGARSEYLGGPSLDFTAISISSDGRWLSLAVIRSQSDYTIYVAPFDPRRVPLRSEWVEVLTAKEAYPNVAFSPDGNLLYFSSVRDGHNCIWAQRLDRRTKRPQGDAFAVQHFHSPAAVLTAPSFGNPVSLARGLLAVSLRERSGEIWMLKQGR